MASTLRPPPLTHISLTRPASRPTAPTPLTRTQIRCGAGPRSNRGPLLKGRILSTEAILTIQSLKRSRLTDKPHVSPLSRLLKADLIAVLRELLRQDQCALALEAFAAVRSEPWYNTDFALYADLVLGLSRSAMWQEIDCLIEGLEMEGEGVKLDDKKGLGRLIRGLVASERRESLVRVYRVMKRAGWGVLGSGVEVDEYLGKVLSKGFKRFGEVDLAKEVDLAVETYLNACLGR
ncbi:protein THYLAKOID ASSEMBLY 8, chloroplastic [Silene latifolia]|uniref:protein THYLAKOID ASSEMBLY 8, chloroplastic n=1 Tax=Silene latifolia TaxID=37657 RepID=UPI003D7723DC